MGYTTDFEGEFKVNPALAPHHAAYLKKFCDTRRMKRADYDAAALPDPVRHAAGLPLGGEDAPYFVGGVGFMGQGRDKSIRDHDQPPDGQPGLWCQWVPNEDGTAIVWNGAEKFYNYIEWLRYIIQHFLAPWGYVLSGSVRWQGEDRGDKGRIEVTDNKVKIIRIVRRQRGVSKSETGEST